MDYLNEQAANMTAHGIPLNQPGQTPDNWFLPPEATIEQLFLALHGSILVYTVDQAADVGMANTLAALKMNRTGSDHVTTIEHILFDTCLAFYKTVNTMTSSGNGCKLAGSNRDGQLVLQAGISGG